MHRVPFCDDIAQTFSEEGWLQAKAVIPHDLIDEFLRCFEREVKPHRGFLMRQSGQWERHSISAHGLMRNPLLQPHIRAMMPGLDGFVESLLAIATHSALHEICRRLAGGAACRVMQSMLFEQSPATPAHQDNVYLDSEPPGHLFAAWIALEDISAEAGGLYVLPKSATPELPRFSRAEVFETLTYMPTMQAIMANHCDKIITPSLHKGDVLFWSSNIIHGAHKPREERVSRKSLALHMLPEPYGFGNGVGNRYRPQFEIVNGVGVKCNPSSGLPPEV